MHRHRRGLPESRLKTADPLIFISQACSKGVVRAYRIDSILRTILRFAFLSALCFLALILSAQAQISPGPLSRAHQTLEGSTHCASCHKFGGQAALKCLECHTEIAARLNAHRGLHASYGLNPASSQECAKCHSEHNGEDFPLVKWTPTPTGFDHSKTGYRLQGKHAALRCNQCHTADRIAPMERLSIQVRDRSRTFLGLPQACTTCHKDEHNRRLGANCQQCHNFEDWKNVAQFDHNKAKYPLTGLHAQVTCQKCHTPGPDNKPRYVGLVFSKCTDCHADPHKGTFAQTCQSCHSTSGWKRVSLQKVNEKFDHSKTRYPLIGKHQSVDCLACHKGGDFKKPLAFQKCADCHQDIHSGQFARRPSGIECSACHTLDGFKPSKFDVKEHATSAYPLEAKHSSVPCAQCHIPKGRDTLYKIAFAKCMDCHKDEHQGQFAQAPYLNRCEQCHNLKGYRPSTFTLARHKETRFILNGSHVATACGDCHKERPTPEKPHLVLYRFEDRRCTVCHNDPHKGQFQDRMRHSRPDGSPAGCEACHSTVSWKDLQKFDHSKTSFPLLGAHRGTACIDCHKPPNMETRMMNVDFKAAPNKCEQCHEDIHGKQFANANRITPCAECHNSTKWKPSLFDHERRTSFSLAGAHERVRCEACHTSRRPFEGKTVLFYKPTAKECAACHAPAKT
jgi:hypothetical protein